MIVNTCDKIVFAKKFSLKQSFVTNKRIKYLKTRLTNSLSQIILFITNSEYPDHTINKIPIRKGQWKGHNEILGNISFKSNIIITIPAHLNITLNQGPHL